MELRYTKEGWQAASRIPRRVRSATRFAKFLATECKARTTPQRMMDVPKYLAMGRRWMSRLVGYSTTKIAM
jgi:hypothetical protein